MMLPAQQLLTVPRQFSQRILQCGLFLDQWPQIVITRAVFGLRLGFIRFAGLIS